MLTWKAVSAVLTVAAMAVAAPAAVIVSDDFNDKNAGNLAGQAGGTGSWSGAWSGDTAYNVTAGGQVASQVHQRGVVRLFSGTSVGQTLYVAYTLQAGGGDSGYNQYVRLFNSDPTSNATNNTFGARDGQFSVNFGKEGRPAGVDFSTFAATTWRLLLKIEPNVSGTTDRYTLWVDDYGDGTFDKTEASAHFVQKNGNFFGDVALSAIGFYGEANNGARYQDDLIVATTFDEAGAFIPEPATLGLLALGGAAAVLRRRRS